VCVAFIDTIKAAVGDELELDVIVSDGGTCWGLRGAGMTVQWDVGVLSESNPLACPALENYNPGLYCNDSYGNFIPVLPPSGTDPAGTVAITVLDLFGGSGFICDDPMYLGRITFTVNNKATTEITLGTASAGDVVTLDVVINTADTAIWGASFALIWSDGIVEFNAIECPAPPNSAEGVCEGFVSSDGGLGFNITPGISLNFAPVDPGVSVVANEALIFDIDTTEEWCTFGCVPIPGEGISTVGRIEFLVNNNGTHTITIAYPDPGFFSQGGIVGPLENFFPEVQYYEVAATATIVPPCSECACGD